MSNDIIHKSHLIAEAANMPGYEQARTSFSWEGEQSLLDGLSNGKLNIAHEAIDRHVQGGIGDRLAI